MESIRSANENCEMNAETARNEPDMFCIFQPGDLSRDQNHWKRCKTVEVNGTKR